LAKKAKAASVALYRLTAFVGSSAILVGDFEREEATAKAYEAASSGLSFGDPDGEWHLYPALSITRLRIKPAR